MTLTYHDILKRLKQIDEISLLEVLDISSEDIIDRFEDKIETKLAELAQELEDEDQTT